MNVKKTHSYPEHSNTRTKTSTSYKRTHRYNMGQTERDTAVMRRSLPSLEYASSIWSPMASLDQHQQTASHVERSSKSLRGMHTI